MKKNRIILLVTLCMLANGAFAQDSFNSLALFDSMFLEMKYHYPIFKERNIDWDKKGKEFRPLVNSKTSKDSLFKVLVDMYGPINDFHIVFGTHDRKYRLRTWGWGKPKFHERFRNDSLRNAFWQNSFKTLYSNGFAQIKTYGEVIDDRALFYYSISEKFAYLNITRCQLHELDSFPKSDKLVLEKFIDSFMVVIQNKKGLIIDLRSSQGGEDEFVHIIASRLTDRKYEANFSRIFRKNIFDSIQTTHFVEPKGKIRFTKPIILLTNDGARSAADVFALTLKQLPQVKIIGVNTFGSFGISSYKDFNNGWYISYPIEKFYSPQGQCMEGIGVPVDNKIENGLDDLINRNDKVVVEALKQLKK